jgi:hypothetical protein
MRAGCRVRPSPPMIVAHGQTCSGVVVSGPINGLSLETRCGFQTGVLAEDTVARLEVVSDAAMVPIQSATIFPDIISRA